MKRLWTHAELVETFTLLPDEHDLVRHKTPPSQLAFALMLKCVQLEERFPARPREIPRVVVQHMAAQLGLDPALSLVYEWQGRTVESHRAQIRALLGLREATTQDLQDLAVWLCQEVAPQDHRRAYLIDAAQTRLRTLYIERPTPDRLARFVDSASTTFEHTFYTTTAAALSNATRQRLDALVTLEATLDPAERTTEDLDAIPTAANASVFYMLKQDPGALSLKTALETTVKLIRLRQVDLPPAQ